MRNLVDIASKGGNFLLNVGPTAEGAFPGRKRRAPGSRSAACMRVARRVDPRDHRRARSRRCRGAACTQRRLDAATTRLYLHVWDRPTDGILVVPGLLNEVRRARPIATAGTPIDLRVERQGDDLRIGLGLGSGPGPAPDDVIVLDIAGAPRVKAPTK